MLTLDRIRTNFSRFTAPDVFSPVNLNHVYGDVSLQVRWVASPRRACCSPWTWSRRASSWIAPANTQVTTVALLAFARHNHVIVGSQLDHLRLTAAAHQEDHKTS
jgi:hypothetical protein